MMLAEHRRTRALSILPCSSLPTIPRAHLPSSSSPVLRNSSNNNSNKKAQQAGGSEARLSSGSPASGQEQIQGIVQLSLLRNRVQPCNQGPPSPDNLSSLRSSV